VDAETLQLSRFCASGNGVCHHSRTESLHGAPRPPPSPASILVTRVGLHGAYAAAAAAAAVALIIRDSDAKHIVSGFAQSAAGGWRERGNKGMGILGRNTPYVDPRQAFHDFFSLCLTVTTEPFSAADI